MPVISQCPPPSRWTTSGKSQHLDQQGGLAIMAAAAAALLLRNLLTNLCVRSSYDLCLIKLSSSRATGASSAEVQQQLAGRI